MKDNHVAGEGNAYYTLFREYDPDLGRWWRPDPIFQPWQSPYSAFDGNPIMFTDVWGLEAKKEEAPLKGFTPEDPLITPDVVVTAKALEGTRKMEYVSGYSKPLLWVKHDGNWIISNVYNAKMKNLVDNLNNKDYNPSSDGFNLDAPLSDGFLSEFANRASKQWGNRPRLLNKIFEKVGYLNPFFAGHGLEDNSQEMAGLFGLAGGLFKKAFGLFAGKLGTSKTTQQLLSEFATEAEQTVGGSGRVNGILKHSEFARRINSLKNPQIVTEVTYKNGVVVPYGTKGGVRLDVVEYNANGSIKNVFDLKTGKAKLTNRRIQSIQRHLPNNAPILELKP